MNQRQDGLPERNRTAAQEAADRIRLLREEFAGEELQSVLALTPEQRARFEDWSRVKLAELAQQFDVDTSASQKRISWAMRIASTLGAMALCAAIVLLFLQYWGYLGTGVQLTVVILTPLLLLAGTEYAARRERTAYFTNLLALVSLAAFVMNLAVAGSIFNVVSTERALLAWGAFSLLLAYRYGLGLMLALGLLLLVSYIAAAYTARLGYHWLEFYDRPEHFLVLGLVVCALPFVLEHRRNTEFPPIYRLIGALVFFLALLTLTEWGDGSYLPWDSTHIEHFYEAAGLLLSAAAIWCGIARNWSEIVNAGSVFFIVFLFTRLYHWWWAWMPRYLFFATIGALGVALVWAFKRVRSRMIHREGMA